MSSEALIATTDGGGLEQSYSSRFVEVTVGPRHDLSVEHTLDTSQTLMAHIPNVRPCTSERLWTPWALDGPLPHSQACQTRHDVQGRDPCPSRNAMNLAAACFDSSTSHVYSVNRFITALSTLRMVPMKRLWSIWWVFVFHHHVRDDVGRHALPRDDPNNHTSSPHNCDRDRNN